MTERLEVDREEIGLVEWRDVHWGKISSYEDESMGDGL
jgi:hypothetical protein